MPVASFVMGAEGWTPLEHKGRLGGQRHVPVGPIHAVEPTAGTAVCTGGAMELDPRNRSFTAWSAGTCPECSERIEPRGGPDPTEVL